MDVSQRIHRIWGAHLVHAINYHITTLKAVEEAIEIQPETEEEVSDD